jgi:hypothetical protein
MKSWHVVVLDGWREIEDKISFSAGDSKVAYDAKKAEYDEINAANAEKNAALPEGAKKLPIYVVKREWY